MAGLIASATDGSKRVLLAIGSILVIGVGLMTVSSLSGDAQPPDTARIDAARFGERILVIAPHPDDEVIAPGGLTREALASGARVRAVVITCGDGFKKAAALGSRGRTDAASYLRLGEVRHLECDAALARLGVPPQDRVFLGYPDAGLRSLWEFDWDASQAHRARNGATAVPYDYALRPGAPYCGSSLASDLERLIDEYRPTSIVYPDPNDQHPDHRAAAAFVEYALGDLGFSCRRFTYLAHYGHYPRPWAYLPRLYVRPPAELGETGTEWSSLSLTASAESEKLAAVMCYRSQVRLPHMNVYLRSFVRRNELFGTYAPVHPLRLEQDAAPPASPDSEDVVVQQPADPAVPEILRRGSAPSAVRMAIGPTTLWVGVSVPGSSAGPASCAVHLRIIGDGEPARFDAIVHGDTVELSGLYADSAEPAGVVTRRTEDTTWVGIPVSAVAGRDMLLASGEVVVSGRRTAGTSWRPVALR